MEWTWTLVRRLWKRPCCASVPRTYEELDREAQTRARKALRNWFTDVGIPNRPPTNPILVCTLEEDGQLLGPNVRM